MLLDLGQELPPSPPVQPAPTETISLAFSRQVLDRLPVAEAVLWLWAYVLHPDFGAEIFRVHRGRSFEGLLTFPVFVDRIADALLQPDGKARPSLLRAQRHGPLPTGQRAVYGKLGRVPWGLSLGFLEETTARRGERLPAGVVATPLPASLAAMTPVILDGKQLKRAAQRLLPVRGTPGKVFGGQVLATLRPGSGLVVALAADPDGEANAWRLVPQVRPRARARIAGVRLWVADRPFCGLKPIALFRQHGDHFLIRQTRKIHFHPDPQRPAGSAAGAPGPPVIQEWGWLGDAKQAGRCSVRRITLDRPGQEAIVLVTDLLDAPAISADDLLAVSLARWGIEPVFRSDPAVDLLRPGVSLARWGIEPVFPQVTEVFPLQQLIGSTPRATVFQAAFCPVWYTMIQVVRATTAATRPASCPVESLSGAQIFTDVERQLIALTEVVPPAEVSALFPACPTRAEVMRQLRRLLEQAWTPQWVQAVNQKPRAETPKVKRSGAHTSVHKILEAHRQKHAAAKAPA